MGSEKGLFGVPENSLLRRGAAAAAAGMLALSLSACETTNTTGSNSGSEIVTSVNGGGTSTETNNGNEAVPGVNRGGLRPVEGSNTDPGLGLAYSNGDLRVCVPGTDGISREYSIKNPSSVEDVVGTTVMTGVGENASAPECSSDTSFTVSGDPYSGWRKSNSGLHTSCIKVYDENGGTTEISVNSVLPTNRGTAMLFTEGC